MSSPEKYAHDIHPKALRILRSLTHFAGKASTSKLTDNTGYQNNVLNYWFGQLIDDGVIEKVDEKDDSTPIPANVYRITDFGEAVVEEAEGTQVSLDDRVQTLEAKMDSVEVLRESHRELEEQVDALEDRVDKLAQLLKAVKDGQA